MDVFFHAGANKTGSTALQAALHAGRAALAAAGIHYPEDEGGWDAKGTPPRWQSGNAQRLAALVQPATHWPGFATAAAEAWLDRCIEDARGGTLLFSTEAAARLDAEGWARLDALLARRGGRLRVIYYVRHVLDHAASGFAQRLKKGRAGQPRPGRPLLDDHVAAYACFFAESLQACAEALGQDRLACRLYEHDRDDIPGHVLRLVAPGVRLALPATGVVNRSPDGAEQQLLEALHAVPGGEAMCGFASRMLQASAAAGVPFTVSEDAFATFAARNAPAVEAVNARFLPPETPLRLTSGRIRIGAPPPPLTPETAAALLRLLQGARSEWKQARARQAG